MIANGSAFSAATSAAGYLYQARLALALCLKFAYRESGIEVAIEKLDDVSFEKDGIPLELLQTKHHIKRVGKLTDTSDDIWKTLRIWCESIKKDPSLLGHARFALITTGQAPAGSAAACLRSELSHAGQRDIQKAEHLLTAAAEKSTNNALEPAFGSFRALTPEMRKSLLTAVEVLDQAPVLGALEAEIEEPMRMIAPRGKAATAREQLEGWWWPRICKALQEKNVRAISILELEAKLDDIRESQNRDSLPLDMEHVEPGEEDVQALSEMMFIRQLQTVGLNTARIHYAKRDYYRAFTQRSMWVRKNLLFDGEVSRFENAYRRMGAALSCHV